MRFLTKKQHQKIILLYLIMVISNIAIQLSTDAVVSLDSWTIYHIVESIIKQQEILPRAILYTFYPLSYLPLVPAAALTSTLESIKFFYPLISSLFIIPLYGLTTLSLRRGQFSATLTIALITDFFLRAVAATPQGIGLIFFFSALYFLKKNRGGLFLVSGIGLILTHHLTALVLVIWTAAHLLQQLYEIEDKKQEKAVVAFMLLFTLDWFIVSYLSGKNVESAFLLIKLLPTTIALLALIIFSKKYQLRILKKIELVPEKYIMITTIAALTLFFTFLFTFSTHSFLSTHGLWSFFFIPVYIVAPIFGLTTLLRQKNKTKLLFSIFLAAGFTLIIVLRLNCIFDAYRLLPFMLIPLIIAAYNRNKNLGKLLLVLAVFTLILHGAANFSRLTYTTGEKEAAYYARDHLAAATVATDTKLSALFLGLSHMPATFEGSYWLFTQRDLAPWIKTFNRYRFQSYPIRYIAISQSMLEKGADISWSSLYQKIPTEQLDSFDQVGERIFSNGEVIIWQIDENIINNAAELEMKAPSSSLAENITTLISGKKAAEPAGEPTINPQQAYGSTCGN